MAELSDVFCFTESRSHTVAEVDLELIWSQMEFESVLLSTFVCPALRTQLLPLPSLPLVFCLGVDQ